MSPRVTWFVHQIASARFVVTTAAEVVAGSVVKKKRVPISVSAPAYQIAKARSAATTAAAVAAEIAALATFARPVDASSACPIAPTLNVATMAAVEAAVIAHSVFVRLAHAQSNVTSCAMVWNAELPVLTRSVIAASARMDLPAKREVASK